MPGLRRNEQSVELELPGYGAMAVATDRIVAYGPDPAARRQVAAQLGTWARGQWLRAQGLTTLNGTCIARDGRSIVITGAPGVGSSLLALVLLERGWQLTSDGIVAWGADNVPLQIDAPLTLDREVVRRVDASRLHTAVSGRDRVHVQPLAVGTGPLAGSVILGRRLALTEPRIIRTEPTHNNSGPLAERLRTAMIPALVPQAKPLTAPVPALPGLQVIRPRSVEEAIVRSSAPPVLADLIEPTLLEWCP